jgi:hypothetical protein
MVQAGNLKVLIGENKHAEYPRASFLLVAGARILRVPSTNLLFYN